MWVLNLIQGKKEETDYLEVKLYANEDAYEDDHELYVYDCHSENKIIERVDKTFEMPYSYSQEAEGEPTVIYELRVEEKSVEKMDTHFYNICAPGEDNLRGSVAMMMDNNPTLSKLKGDKYYDVEDSIIQLIREWEEKIWMHHEDKMQLIKLEEEEEE